MLHRVIVIKSRKIFNTVIVIITDYESSSQIYMFIPRSSRLK
jgi:hypothetical protein